MIITNVKAVIAVALMGLVVYTTRISGYWLAGRLQINNRIKAWLEYLPGCILISIVAPFVLTGDILQIIGASATIAVMYFSRNLLLSMIAGIGIVAAARLLLL